MICTKCGISVADNSTVCPNCGQVFVYAQQPEQQPQQYQQAPDMGNKPTYSQGKAIGMLIWAVLCNALGVISIIFSILALVNGNAIDNLWLTGQYQLAQQKANDANKFTKWALIVNIIGAILLVIIIIFYIIFMGVLIGSGAIAGSYY